MKKFLILFGAAIIVSVIYFLNPLRFIDNFFYDLNFTFQSKTPVDSVVIVGIDRQSIKTRGAWPWRRSMTAQLVRQIASAGPRVIALDFHFPRRDDAGESDSLSAVLSSLSNVVLPFSVDRISTGTTSDVHISLSPVLLQHSINQLTNENLLDRNLFYNASGIDLPDSLFFNTAKYSGFLNMSTSNSSQKLREAIHVIKTGDHYLPSFAVAAAAAFYGIPMQNISLDGMGSVTIGEKRIPVSSYAASLLLNFRSEKYPVPHYSASEIIDGNFDKNIFADKAVFIGVTDPMAAADFFTTPVQSQYPGVAVWATAVLDIIHDTWIRTDALLPGILHFLLVLLIFPGLTLIVPSKHQRMTLVIALFLMLAGVTGSIILFRTVHCFVSPAPPLYSWVFLLIWLVSVRINPTLTGTQQLELDPPLDALTDVVPPPSGGSQITLKALQCDTMDHILHKSRLQFIGMSPCCSGSSLIHTTDESSIDLQSNVPDPADLTKLLECSGGQIIRLLGSGGMADVYLMWHPRLESYRVVKVMKPYISDNFLSRFETEIRIFSKLDHPNIVRCFGAGDWHSLPYLEMEYVNGASFGTILQTCNLITVNQAVAVGVLVCRALEYAHSRTMHIYGKVTQGIIHGALKPANIMMTRSGRIKLTDFGIARPQEHSFQTAEAENVAGTLPYIAPEIYDRNEYMPRTDTYALGAILYELISGERAFPQTSVTEIINAKVNGKYKPLSLSVKIPLEVEAIIDKSLHVEPSGRYQSAKELRTVLEKVFFNTGCSNGFGHLSALIKRIWPS
jgi:serine/threonine-protein kinase